MCMCLTSREYNVKIYIAMIIIYWDRAELYVKPHPHNGNSNSTSHSAQWNKASTVCSLWRDFVTWTIILTEHLETIYQPPPVQCTDSRNQRLSTLLVQLHYTSILFIWVPITLLFLPIKLCILSWFVSISITWQIWVKFGKTFDHGRSHLSLIQGFF